MEHDYMIEALASNGSNHSLYVSSLPRRARCRQDFADAQVSHVFSEAIPEDGIAVAQQVARELSEGKCQLLYRPLPGRVRGHVEVQNATPVMGQHQKHVKDLETDSGHREEVDGHQLFGVILQECAPGPRRRFAAAHHIFAHAALTDVDAKFEHLAVDAGRTPTGILSAHLQDQFADLAGDSRSPAVGHAAPSRSRKRRKPLRYQAMTVSGLTMTSAERQSRQMRDRKTHNSRLLESITGVCWRIAEAHRFGGAEPGFPVGEQRVNGRSRAGF